MIDAMSTAGRTGRCAGALKARPGRLSGSILGLALPLVVMVPVALPAESAGLPLTEVARLTLPGPSNRFDYQSVDPGAHRLYISHMDADRLLEVDTRRREVIRLIPAPGVHGVLAVPEIDRVFASATNARQVITIDAGTGTVIAKAPAGQYPDGIAWDPADRRAFVSDEAGGTETVVDAHGRRVDTVKLGGEAGNVQYDAGSGHVLVDVQANDEVAVIDPRKGRVVERVPLAGCDHDHGLLIDSPHRLAFIACDRSATLLTLDLTTMKVIGSATVGPAPDVLAFDPSLRRLYVAAESGVVAIFEEADHGLRKLGQALLAPYAHTVAVDPVTHLVYFPLQSGSSGRPQLLIMRPT